MKCMCAECQLLGGEGRLTDSSFGIDVLVTAPEIDQLRELIRQTIVYLDARVGNKPSSRGYALLQRLNAALIRKD